MLFQSTMFSASIFISLALMLALLSIIVPQAACVKGKVLIPFCSFLKFYAICKAGLFQILIALHLIQAQDRTYANFPRISFSTLNSQNEINCFQFPEFCTVVSRPLTLHAKLLTAMKNYKYLYSIR